MTKSKSVKLQIVSSGPKPPATMPPEQQQVWNEVVALWPSSHFDQSQILLEQYCAAVLMARASEKLLWDFMSTYSTGQLLESLDLVKVRKLLASDFDRDSRLCQSLETKLLISKSAISSNRAGAKILEAGKKPWEKS